MSLIPSLNSSEKSKLENKGKNIYRSNKHLRSLANVMEHPEFKSFVEEYMKDWDDTKNIVMFMKLYQAVGKYSKDELSPYEKLAIVQEFIDDPEKRRKVCDKFSNWLSGGKIAENLQLETSSSNPPLLSSSPRTQNSLTSSTSLQSVISVPSFTSSASLRSAISSSPPYKHRKKFVSSTVSTTLQEDSP